MKAARVGGCQYEAPLRYFVTRSVSALSVCGAHAKWPPTQPVTCYGRRCLFSLDEGLGDIRQYPPKAYRGIVLFRFRRVGRIAVRPQGVRSKSTFSISSSRIFRECQRRFSVILSEVEGSRGRDSFRGVICLIGCAPARAAAKCGRRPRVRSSLFTSPYEPGERLCCLSSRGASCPQGPQPLGWW
jgi:hypothetical protein